ncbi:MAG: DnaD domain protein [Clostridiales bacterium]|nr:DnaD domain protein [Clostridiales bacterium]
MNFKRSKIYIYYLHNTAVENVFINEYMIDAPGDYVKVFLLGLMYAEINMSMNNKTIAKQLSLEEEDVLKAWTYWEKKGVIKKHYPNPEDPFRYRVEFLNLKEQIFGVCGKNKKGEDKLPESLEGLMNDKELKKMYSRIEQITGRLFEGKEPVAILGWIKDYGVTPEFIIYAYEYCAKYRNNCKHNYVAAVVREWVNSGLRTVRDVERHLEEYDNRHYLYKRVLRALGFHRNPTEEEKRIMDTWFDDLGFDISKVLAACNKTSGISNPNINYVNSVLRAWSKEGKEQAEDKQRSTEGNIISQVIKSYEEERIKNEKEAEERRNEVYRAVPRIKEIEEETRQIGLEISKLMLSSGSASKIKISQLKKRAEELNNERAYLLTDNNFKLDYMDIWYTCTVCKDTGILDTGERCFCFKDKLEEFEKMI